MKQGLLIVLSGPSGVGKGLLRKKLLNEHLIDAVLSVSLTTKVRKLRERNGYEYNFVSQYEFQRRIENGDMIEYVQIDGVYYGTPKSEIDNNLKAGKNVILEIEDEGAKQVMQKYRGMYTLAVFIAPPDINELERRIRKRDRFTDEEIKAQLEKAEKDMQDKDLYDVCLTNYTIDKTVKRLKTVIDNRLLYIKNIEEGNPVPETYVIKRK